MVPWPLRLRLFLAVYYGLAIVWGVRSIRPAEPSVLDLLVPLVLAVTLGCWAIADARRQMRSIPLLSRHWFVLFALLLVPGYVVWSRGWRGVGWMALHSASWYGLCTATMYAAWTVVYGG
jgi:hypothetical protein